jgi:hypothetical protein
VPTWRPGREERLYRARRADRGTGDAVCAVHPNHPLALLAGYPALFGATAAVAAAAIGVWQIKSVR